MKTVEFIDKVTQLGYLAIENGSFIHIKDTHGRILASTNKEDEFMTDTKYIGFKRLTYADKSLLISILRTYERTSVSLRVEPKKYIYKMPVKRHENPVYLTRAVDNPEKEIEIDWSSKSFVLADSDFHFTDAEVEEYPENVRKLFAVCEKEEV